MTWMPFQDGTSVGQIGSDGGVIVLDHEHTDGARITLERAESRRLFRRPLLRFAITCGIYGWMVHTRFFSDEAEAKRELEQMKVALEEILMRIPEKDAPDLDERMNELGTCFDAFIERFP